MTHLISYHGGANIIKHITLHRRLRQELFKPVQTQKVVFYREKHIHSLTQHHLSFCKL